TVRACFTEHGLAWTRWTRRLLTLASLDRGFLVEADQPGACSQETLRLGIGLEYRASPLEEDVGIMNVLPGVIAPRTKAFGFEPATHRAGRNARKAGVLGNVASYLGSTPAREGHVALSGQATGDGGDLSTHLRRKTPRRTTAR